MSPEEKLGALDKELIRRGYGPVISRFKSFNKSSLVHERFAIEVRIHPNGQKVVIKTAALEDAYFTKSLMQEISTIRLLTQSVEKIDPLFIQNVEQDRYIFKLPQLIDTFADANFYYMVTLYVENDASLDTRFTEDAKVDLLLAFVKYIQLFGFLDLPDRKEYYLYTVPNQVRSRKLLEDSLLDKIKKVYSWVEAQEVSTFAYTAVCADPHAGNLVKSKDSGSNKISVTVLDLEEIHKGSQFLDLSLLYMASQLHYEFSGLPTAILTEFKKYWIADLGSSAEKIMREALASHADKLLAEAMFRGYVIVSTMNKLLNTYNSKELSEVFLKGGKRIIQENVDWLASKGLV